MMLEYAGQAGEAARLEKAVKDTIRAGEMTGDIYGSHDTKGFVKAVIGRL
jgi:isocitrate/isopropylmalate dehydrogenase